MAQFLDSLTVTEIDDDVFEVTGQPFRYQSDIVGLVSVPVGFRTDFASVPRIGFIYALLGNTAHQAAVIHDWAYYSDLMDRETADKVLLEAMEATGIEPWKRKAIYWGVRLGGWKAWADHRKRGDCLAAFHPTPYPPTA